jgi:transketolase
MGDGCMMEGISHEACSLAGTLGLGKLVAFYDDNGISIDSEKGHIAHWYTDDVPKRFAAYGWQVIPNVDGHDVEAVDRAIRKAKREKARPTLISCKTVIAKGAPKKANTGSAHGAPLGADEVAATRQAIGWTHAPFEIPEHVRRGGTPGRQAKRRERRWKGLLSSCKSNSPAEAAEFSAG